MITLRNTAQLKKENARLKKENARLKEENARLANVEEENARLKEENARLANVEEENARLREALEEVEEEEEDEGLILAASAITHILGALKKLPGWLFTNPKRGDGHYTEGFFNDELTKCLQARGLSVVPRAAEHDIEGKQLVDIRFATFAVEGQRWQMSDGNTRWSKVRQELEDHHKKCTTRYEEAMGIPVAHVLYIPQSIGVPTGVSPPIDSRGFFTVAMDVRERLVVKYWPHIEGNAETSFLFDTDFVENIPT